MNTNENRSEHLMQSQMSEAAETSGYYSFYDNGVAFRHFNSDLTAYPIEIYVPEEIRNKVRCVGFFARYTFNQEDSSENSLMLQVRYGESLAHMNYLAECGTQYVGIITSDGVTINNTLVLHAHYSSDMRSEHVECLGENIYLYISNEFVNAIRQALNERANRQNITSGSMDVLFRPCTNIRQPSNTHEGHALSHEPLADRCYTLSPDIQSNMYDFIVKDLATVNKAYEYTEICPIDQLTKFNDGYSVPDAEFDFTSIKVCYSASDITNTQGGELCVLKNDMHIHVQSDLSWLALDGNGHKVNFYTNSYNTHVSAGRAITNSTPHVTPCLEGCIIDQDFNSHHITRTDAWESDRNIIVPNENEINPNYQLSDNEQLVYVPLKDEWLEFFEYDEEEDKYDAGNAYVNWTAWYVSFNGQILQVEDIGGKKYAEAKCVKREINPDADQNKFNIPSSIILYNYPDKESSSFYIDGNGVISLPTCVTTAYLFVGEPSVRSFFMWNVQGTCGDWANTSLHSEKLYITDCKLIHFTTLRGVNNRLNLADPMSYQTIKNTEIAYVAGCAVQGQSFNTDISRGSLQHISGCYIHDTGYARQNVGAINAGLKFHIHDNRLINNGYASIIAGHNDNRPGNCLKNYPTGCIERNSLGQTKEYFRSSHHRVLVDSGCIHVKTITNGILVRHNVINRYGGRGWDRGIFCDDGCTYIFIYENIIRQTPNGHSIDARYATGRTIPAGYPLNNHKLVACNLVDSNIRLMGVEGNSACDVHTFSNISINGNEQATDHYEDVTTNAENKHINISINVD